MFVSALLELEQHRVTYFFQIQSFIAYSCTLKFDIIWPFEFYFNSEIFSSYSNLHIPGIIMLG